MESEGLTREQIDMLNKPEKKALRVCYILGLIISIFNLMFMFPMALAGFSVSVLGGTVATIGSVILTLGIMPLFFAAGFYGVRRVVIKIMGLYSPSGIVIIMWILLIGLIFSIGMMAGIFLAPSAYFKIKSHQLVRSPYETML